MGRSYGFAIPINLAKPIVRSIIDHGRFIKPWLGISGIDREIASYYNADISIDKGIFIADENATAQQRRQIYEKAI